MAPPRVLLVDDDAAVREIVSELVASWGYACEAAADGAAGVARFEEGGWDLVITDLAMPGMSGWEVADAIRRRSPATPVILITGLSDPGVARRARALGLPVVAKPFDAERLHAVIAVVLRAGSSREDRVSSQG
jgi:CheY-like chemotaxis protein